MTCVNDTSQTTIIHITKYNNTMLYNILSLLNANHITDYIICNYIKLFYFYIEKINNRKHEEVKK